MIYCVWKRKQKLRLQITANLEFIPASKCVKVRACKLAYIVVDFTLPKQQAAGNNSKVENPAVNSCVLYVWEQVLITYLNILLFKVRFNVQRFSLLEETEDDNSTAIYRCYDST